MRYWLARSALASLAALAAATGACVLVIDDPSDWRVAPPSGDTSSGGGSGGCSGDAVSCSCTSGATYGKASGCGPDLVKGGLCCADLEYPGANTECRCEQLSCKRNADGCQCYLGTSYGPSASCDAAPGEVCCSYGSSCECNSSNCSAERRVERCDVAHLSCGERRRVATCSP